MKCQRCSKQATLHITEVLGEERYEELHFCEGCAKKHLYETPEPAPKPAEAEAAFEPGDKQCDACGVKFAEFRNTGRLGCPHDYDAFRDELLPLLESIHGDVRHQGKTPQRLPKSRGTQQELAGLRKKLQQAIREEAYEAAAELRDRIRVLGGE